jgi:hypothetical protein
MPLSDDNILQSNSGFLSGAPTPPTGDATLANPVATGNGVLLFVFAEGVVMPTPAGFIEDAHSGTVAYFCQAFRKVDASGESSWAMTTTVGGVYPWIVLELSGLDTTTPLVATPGTNEINSSTLTTITATSGTTAILDVIAFAVFGLYEAGAGGGSSWTSFTGGFTELVEVTTVAFGDAHALSVTRAYVADGSAQACTGTRATNGAGNMSALVVLYAAGEFEIVPGPTLMAS